LNFIRLILRKVLQFGYCLIANIGMVLKSDDFVTKEADLLLPLFYLHHGETLIVKCQSKFLNFFVQFSVSIVIPLHAFQLCIQGLEFPIKSLLLNGFCLVLSL
jgi:hypothetical protein